MHAFYIPTPDFGLLKEKAETGDAKAQNDLGYHYSFGQDVTQNFVEAFRWFELSAQQGFAEAQNNMARCYHYGRGVEKDLRLVSSALVFSFRAESRQRRPAFARLIPKRR